ncbi:MAG: cobyric acid synthase [Eubacterium sp.]|nr:cobyric acid synthase [Eubacterium sp.]
MAKVMMIQGTMSGVGKSFLTAGLCRLMKRDGYRVAPFKSQNMALNSYVTEEGLEIGRAQAMQAEAAGITPLACMNPVLLKPTSHTSSQVIVNGRVFADMGAREYFSYKQNLIPQIKQAFQTLEGLADIIVIEGAGSPAEVNLREHDIVNMGLAELVDAPVLLAGDIDRGGVFAQLLGTLLLLTAEERKRIKGLIINRFRGDVSLLGTGIEILEKKGGIPVKGVVPYMDVQLEDEDSLAGRFADKKAGAVDLVVIRYPTISNFTDFNVFEQIPEVSVRYVASVDGLGQPDLIFLPGSKNTMGDLRWMRQNGLEEAVKSNAARIPVCGICGGFQMLGEQISGPQGAETGTSIKGMGLLPVETKMQSEKVRRQVKGVVNRIEGFFSALSGKAFEGYEIHMGISGSNCGETAAGALIAGSNKNVCGTYIHGIFDKAEAAAALVGALADRKGICLAKGTYMDYRQFKEKQYDRLADLLKEYLDMEEMYGILREAHVK